MVLVITLAALLANAVPDERLSDAVAGVGTRSHDESCRRVEAFLAAHPDTPERARALLWMAELRRVDGDEATARALYAQTLDADPRGPLGLAAVKAVADMDVSAHRYSPALLGYARLAGRPEPYWRFLGTTGVADARSARRRDLAFLVVMVGLLGLLSFRLAAARAALWPPPEECLYLLPVAALSALSSVVLPADERAAVLSVAGGGLALVFVNAVFFRLRPPRGVFRGVEAVLGVAQGAALLYCAVIACGLWTRFANTLANGADR